MKKYTKFNALIDSVKFNYNVYKPGFFFGFGLSMLIGGGVIAVVNTRKNIHEIEAAEKAVVDAHERKKNTGFLYSDKENSQLVLNAYKDLAAINGKTYIAPIVMAIVGTLALGKSFKDLQAMGLNYAGLAGLLGKELNDIHARLEDKYGKDEADRICYGLEQREIQITEKDEKGNDKTVTKTVNYVSPDWNGYYTYKWTKKSSTFKQNPGLREAVVDSMEQYANDVLSIRAQTKGLPFGYLYLNEILEQFDIDIAEEGQDVGWILMPGNPIGDNEVQISMCTAYETNPETGLLEEVVLLTFNVDGDIRSHMFPKSKSKWLRKR